MHMFYWFGTDLGSFLFPGYNVTTTWGLIATCLGLGSLAVIFEGMKVTQIKLRKVTIASMPSEQSVSSEDSILFSRFATRSLPQSTSTNCHVWSRWLLEVLHWSMHTTLGYLLMLAVMSYNGYLSIALAFGGGLGYWFFGTTLRQLNMLRFNESRKNVQCDSECSDAIINVERRQSTVSVIEEELGAGVSGTAQT